jgi:hypothetical protein
MFISGANLKVIQSAVQTLHRISGLSEGAQAVVDANVLEYVPKLLESAKAEVRKWTWEILEALVCHETTARAAVECLLSLLR